jgi:Glycosyltransferase Family 4
LSDYNLPDWRIEKCATSALNRGYQVFFAGLHSRAENNTFSVVYRLDWTPRARRAIPCYWHCVKKQLKRILIELRPDVVHAHNIFSAKIISEFDIPFVYDDHEYWPSYVERQIESYNLNLANSNTSKYNARSLIRRLLLGFLNRRFFQLGLKWETELVSSTPTMTVSEAIASEIRRLGGTKVFITPNFPMKKEIENLQPPKFHKELSSVYAGIEPKHNIKIVHRNMDGFVDLFNRNNDVGSLTMIGIDDPIRHNFHCSSERSCMVTYRGFLPRHLMYQEMQNSSIGLIPFRSHWSHKYISPNKAYEYAHAGLLVMCSSSFVTIKNILNEHCITFGDYDDLISQLRYCKDNIEKVYEKRMRVYGFAKENLIWEKYEQNIFDAYKIA